MSQPDPATHESKGLLFYTGRDSTRSDPLSPYWALADLLINQYDGYAEDVETTIDGEEFSIDLNYHKSGIAPREEDQLDADRVYEFDITVEGDGERGGSYQVKPRWSPLRHYDTGETIDAPFFHVADEGISVQYNLSNMSLDEVSELFPAFLRALFDEVGKRLNRQYFARPSGGSIQEVERYVRITRENAKKITKKGGPFDRLAMLLSDLDGTAGMHKWNNSEAMGYIHQFRTDPTGSSEMINHHTRGKQLKLYLPRDPDSFDEDDPLYHHKLGALFRKSLNSGAVRWSEKDELVEELDEALFSLLDWSDIPTDSGPGFVSDDHFSASSTDREDVTTYSDPTPRLETEQEALFLRTMSDLSDSRLELVRAIATDGGRHVEDVASDIDVAVSTVYRALRDLPDILESDNGVVRFASAKLAEEVRSIVEDVERTLERGADRAASLIDVDLRSNSTSAFERWLAHYGAEFDAPEDVEDQPTIRIDTVLSHAKSRTEPLLDNVLEEMLLAWKSDGRDPLDLRDALVEVDLARGESVRSPLAALR